MKIYISKKGFTLIEVLVSIGIFSAIVVLLGSLQSGVFKFNEIIQVGLKNQGEGKKILKPFSGEVRSASQSNLGAFPLATVSSDSFSFYSDTDNDGLKEKIRYFMEDGTFKKGVIVPSGNPLSYNTSNEKIVRIVHDVINDVIFKYYDDTYDGTENTTPLNQPVTPADVRLVEVEIVIDSDPNKPPAPVTVKTQVSIRNLKGNL